MSNRTLAVLLFWAAGLGLWLVPPPALAADEPRANVFYGFNDQARPNCWTPVLLEIPGPGKQTTAAIYPSPGTSLDRGRFTTPVKMSTFGDTEDQRIWLYVRPGDGRFRATAYLEGDRRLLMDNRWLGGDCFADQAAVILTAGRSLGLKELFGAELQSGDGRSRRLFGAAYESGQADLWRLPDRAIGYDGVDALVLVNPKADDLRGDQVEAIADFVKCGGRLMVFVGRSWQELPRNSLSEILPAKFGPPVAVTDLAALEQRARLGLAATGVRGSPWHDLVNQLLPASARLQGPISVPTLYPKPGARVTLQAGGEPLAVEGLLGLGTVTVVGLDPDGLRARPGRGAADSGEAGGAERTRPWPGVALLTAGLLNLTPQLLGDSAGPVFYGGTLGRSAAEFTTPSEAFGSATFAWAIIFLTVLYIIVGGPVLHLYLRYRRQLHLSWPAYFGLTLAVALVCFLLVSLVRNRATVVRTLTVVDYPADESAALGRSLHSVRFPDSLLYDVTMDGRGGHLAVNSPDTMAGILTSDDRIFDYAPTLLGVSGLAVKSNQYRSFAAQWRTDNKPPLAADVRRGEDGYVGSLRNNSGANLGELVLIGPDSTYRIGSLAAGKSYSFQPQDRRDSDDYLLTLDKLIRNETGIMAQPQPVRGGWEEGAETPVKKVAVDVYLSSCYEFYRRHLFAANLAAFASRGAAADKDEDEAASLSRAAWARPYDLSPALANGYGLVIGLAELEVPDGLRIDGRRPSRVDRLVIFRQVVRIAPAAPRTPAPPSLAPSMLPGPPAAATP